MMRTLEQSSGAPLPSPSEPQRGALHRSAALLCALGLAAAPVSAREPSASEAHADAHATHATTSVAAETHAVAAPAAPAPNSPQSTEPPPANLTAQAKQLYLLGAEAFGAQRNADAIRYFRNAAKLVPSPKLTYNIALAYDEMGDTGPALAAFRAFLSEEPDSPHRADVSERVAELEHRLQLGGVQLVTLTSEPPGATLRVGGEALGVTPWAGELAPGAYQVRLELSGYAARTADVAVAPEQPVDVQLALEKLPEPAPARPSAFSRIEPLTWSFLGVGVAALAGGLAFELSRAQSSQRADRASSSESAAEARGAAHAKQMTSLLLLGAGGGFVIGGGVLLVLDLSRPQHVGAAKAQLPSARRGATLALPCRVDFCGLLGQGHF